MKKKHDLAEIDADSGSESESGSEYSESESESESETVTGIDDHDLEMKDAPPNDAPLNDDNDTIMGDDQRGPGSNGEYNYDLAPVQSLPAWYKAINKQLGLPDPSAPSAQLAQPPTAQSASASASATSTSTATSGIDRVIPDSAGEDEDVISDTELAPAIDPLPPVTLSTQKASRSELERLEHKFGVR